MNKIGVSPIIIVLGFALLVVGAGFFIIGKASDNLTLFVGIIAFSLGIVLGYLGFGK